MLKKLISRLFGAIKISNDNGPEGDDAALVRQIEDVGKGNPVIISESGVGLFGERLRQMEAAGMIELRDMGGEMCITPVRRASPAWAVRPADDDGNIVRGTYRRPGRFISERNPVWSAWVLEFRRQHGRRPRVDEMMARFPVMSRRTAYRYISAEASKPRLVRSA